MNCTDFPAWIIRWETKGAALNETNMLRVKLAAIMILLLTLSFSGCGGDGGSEPSDNSSGNATALLSPEGVVMVNGKELTRTDLADAEALLKLEMNEGMQGISGEVAQLFGEDTSLVTIPKPDTPEYVGFEEELVEKIIQKEIIAQEWEKMGRKAITTEVLALYEEKIESFGGEGVLKMSLSKINRNLDWYNQQLEDIVIARKVYEVTDKIAPAGVDELETELNKNEAFINWYGAKRNLSDIQYADQYRPASPFVLSDFAEEQAFRIRFPVWIESKSMIDELSNQIIASQIWLASPDYSGLSPATEPLFQIMEKMQTEMAARTLNMNPERKKNAEQMLAAMREYTALSRQDIAVSAGGVLYSPDFNQLPQMYEKILALGGEWLW